MVSEEGESPRLQRWLTGGALVLVLLAVWLIVRPLAVPILWAAILAFLFSPLQSKLSRALGGRRTAAAGIITGLTPVAIFVPLTLLGLAFANQIASLTTQVEGDTSLFDLAGWADPGRHPRIAAIVAWLGERFDLQLGDVQGYLRQAVYSAARKPPGVI